MLDVITKYKVAVGMSGGVDSSVTAALLVEQGYEVTGVFLECFRAPGCRVDEDRKDAMDVAVKLGIPFKVLDFKQAYRERVMVYFYREYQAGRTPNPDVMCNREIKFGLFYRWAIEEQGFDYVATGHYARIGKLKTQNLELKTTTQSSKVNNALAARSFTEAQDDRLGVGVRPGLASVEGQALCLLRGVDEQKDQSYFLYQLRQEQLAHILFPIGEMTKSQVRAEARRRGLAVADKPDSQGICFVGEVGVRGLLQSLGMKEKPGKVFYKLKAQSSTPKGGQAKLKTITNNSKLNDASLDSSPTVQNDSMLEVGRHEGAGFYTIGQRIGWPKLKTSNNKQETELNRIYKQNFVMAGLDMSNLPPLYVVEKDVEKNVLVVGERQELMRDEMVVDHLHWINQMTNDKIQMTRGVKVRIRHGGKLVGAKLKIQNSKLKTTTQKLKLKLSEKLFGVAPGQAVVFYSPNEASAELGRGEVVLGGGIIRG